MQRRFGTFGILTVAVFLLTLSGSSQVPDDHGNDPTPFAATLITVDNFELQGALEQVGDVDCFMFQAEAGNAYRFMVLEADEALAPLLILFDRNGLTVLALDEKGNQNARAQIEWKPFVTGFYYLCLRNAVSTQGVGAYRLRVQSDRAASGDPASLPEPPTPSTPQNGEGPPDSNTESNPPDNDQPEEMQAPNLPQTGAPGRVAVLGGDDRASLEDVRSFLQQVGAFATVELIDVSQDTPDAQTLSGYEAVLVWADSGFKDAVALGDRLADYVDQGGGVVVAAVSFDAPSPFDPDVLEGRFFDQGYYAIAPGVDNVDAGRLTLGQVLAPDHPIMQGVSGIDGGPKSFHSPTTALTAGSSSIALWSNGDVLVAVKTVGQTRRADINLFPPSGRVDSDLWPFRPSNKVPELFANALRWVAGGS